jgi:hypothetical protein
MLGHKMTDQPCLGGAMMIHSLTESLAKESGKY